MKGEEGGWNFDFQLYSEGKQGRGMLQGKENGDPVIY